MSTHPPPIDDAQEAAEEEQLFKMEQEVEQMAEKILEYRTTLPDHLTSTLSSILASQRPTLPPHLHAESDTPGWEPAAGAGGSMNPPSADSTEEAEKIRVLKQKISNNASELPVVLNRMKQYMERIDKLEPVNRIAHPAFKRKKAG